MSDRTDLQEAIVLTAAIHPEWSDERIADDLDCSAGYVREVTNRYRATIIGKRLGLKIREWLR